MRKRCPEVKYILPAVLVRYGLMGLEKSGEPSAVYYWRGSSFAEQGQQQRGYVKQEGQQEKTKSGKREAVR